MKKSFSKWGALLSVALLMGLSSSVYAQATRTWVSGVGDDVNPCSRTAPCKTFAGAISKTAAGGEINAMDDAGYGGVTITKSITINGGGHIAGILISGAGQNGVVINAAATDVVILRGLSFTGAASPNNPLNAVRYLAARYVVVEDCTISGFTNGINMLTTVVNGRMDIRNVRMTNGTTLAGTTGIHVGAANSISTISDVSVRGYTDGITTRGGVTYLRGSTIVANNAGYNNMGGSLLSFGDNMVSGNVVNGTPTGSIPHF
ncbi:hypothetical protein [Acidovorax sp. ACV01]|uniref:hypothetical protein n=1 Tax=Acidovorax sp. ACV01 TaxID=2769311 RepID=UPI00177E4B74|nr:hypothetical protein [Acidovorax sp. ACV01]MBD9392869.1 hypothetical protein [Acidovorax sp. ACV01]